MPDWKALLQLALPALDEAFAPGCRDQDGKPDWTVGGGAAIAQVFDHRETGDIDIFLQRGRLKELSPAFNEAARSISKNFQWPGHYLKFERPEGEIDFLSAPLQTDPGCSTYRLLGRSVAFETPEEVIVKKLRFRGATFTARDVFDLAIVADRRPDLACVLADEVPDMLDRVREQVRIHASRGIDVLQRAIHVTENGAKILPRTFDLADAVLSDASTIAIKRSRRNLARGPRSNQPPASPEDERDR